jgi:hypothetical protein
VIGKPLALLSRNQVYLDPVAVEPVHTSSEWIRPDDPDFTSFDG